MDLGQEEMNTQKDNTSSQDLATFGMAEGNIEATEGLQLPPALEELAKLFLGSLPDPYSISLACVWANWVKDLGLRGWSRGGVEVNSG